MDKIKSFIYIAVVCVLWACGSNDSRTSAQQYTPVEPDYKNAEMWVCHLNDTDSTGADVFYIPSTWEYDWTTSDDILCRYADVSNEQHRSNMAIEMNKVAKYMADGNNFYSPYYRHISLDTWATLDEDYITRQYESVSLIDVKQAFDHFIKNWNKGRPFVLAGFSQGGKSVVELMKYMPEDIRKYMVAAYVLGYKVTPNDVAVAPWIVAAKSASDIGVTISYNSVSDVKYIKPLISSPTVMFINPVNWRTDSTPAILNDSITVTLDTEHNVLVLDGYDGSHLSNILNILNVGDYHSIEPWLYDQCLHANIKHRIKVFRENN